MPYESLSVAHSPVVAHDAKLSSIHDSGHHIEVAGEPEGVAYEHLLGYVEFGDVDGVISGKGREEFVGVLDVIFSEADAAVEAVYFDDLEFRSGYRGSCPWAQADKSVRRDEDVCREVVRDGPCGSGLLSLQGGGVRGLHQGEGCQYGYK